MCQLRSGCSPAWTALSPPFSGNSPGTMTSLPSGWTLRLLGTLVLMLLPGGALSYCVDPPDIPNAILKSSVGTLIPAGKVIKYGCRPGYKLIAGLRQGHVTCLQNSTWSSAPNFCQKVRCPAPDVNKGTQTPMPRPGEETYAFGDRVTIKCDFGYDIKGRIIGNAQISCKHDGTWDPAVPVCEPVLVCAQPPNISHGQHSDWGKRVFFFGSSVTYKCDRGFSLVGKASIQCIAGDEVTPTWSEPTPQCEETQCPDPHIQHGSLKSPLPHNYTHRTSVTFQCDPGYILRGADRIQCQADGKWYPQLPVCDLETQCPVPHIQHGSLKSPLPHNYTYRTSVTFQCDPGYILRGADKIQCQADGKWYPQLPVCGPGSVLKTAGISTESEVKDIITQGKPTTVPLEGAEITGTSSGSVLNPAGNFAEPEGEGLVIVIAIGIGTGIGIVVLGAVPAIIASAILKKNRMKVDVS
ncbi:C4b-binding protein alpha chain-like isoform X1 [Trachemys scripta elegans]|uniref:C4b-binding protein alpha chain-like isoform X1 n=1 Tax=Trachemys scripta elegans TaxID=31138 RepID=UPI001557DD7D|nr:C4b-binding protein alpha chain-like isoform X1 [Trachemys scripta elegans]